MSTDLYGVRVLEVSPEQRRVRFRVFVVYYDPAHQSHMPLPRDTSFFFRILRESADTRFGQGGSLGDAVSLDDSLSEDWVDANTHRFVERIECLERRNTPVTDYTVYDDFYYERAGGWSDEERLVQADYDVWVTDPSWIEHLQRGSSWGSTSYETKAYVRPPNDGEKVPDVGRADHVLTPFEGKAEAGTPGYVAFSADGSTLLVSSEMGEIVAYDADALEELWRAQMEEMFVVLGTGPAPDLVWLAHPWQRLSQAWTVRDGAAAEFEPRTAHGSPGGQYWMNMGETSTLDFVDETREVSWSLPAAGVVEACAFSADEQMVAVGGMFDTIDIWNPRTREKIRSIEVFDRVSHLAFSPNGRYLAASIGVRSVVIYRVADGEILRRVDGSTYTSVAWSPRGDQFAVVRLERSGYGGVVNVHRIEQAQAQRDVERNAPSIAQLTNALADDLRSDHGLRDVLTAHGQFVGAVVSVDDTTLVTSSEDGNVFVWSLEDARVKQWLVEYGAPVNSLAITPDRRFVVGGSDDTSVKVWDTNDWSLRHVLESHTAYVRMVAAIDERRVASCSEDGLIIVWDVVDGVSLAVLDGHNGGPVSALFVRPDGQQLVSVSRDNTFLVWDLETGEHQTLFSQENNYVSDILPSIFFAIPNHSEVGHTYRPTAGTFLPDGRLVTVDSQLVVWDVENLRQERRFQLHAWGAEDVALSPDHRTLAVATRGIVLLDVDSLEPVAALPAHGGKSSSVTFGVDGETLIAGGEDGKLRVWNPSALRDFAFGRRQTDAIHNLRISDDGRWAASSSTDGTVALWDLSGRELAALIDHHREPNGPAIAFSPDASRLWIGGQNGRVSLWEPPFETPVAEFVVEKDYPLHINNIEALDADRALVGTIGDAFFQVDARDASTILFEGRTGQVSELAVVERGTLAVGTGYFEPEGADGVAATSHIQGWDLEARALAWTVTPEDYVAWVAPTHRDDRVVVSSPRGGFDVREAKSGAVIDHVPSEQGSVFRPYVDPQGNLHFAERAASGEMRLVVANLEDGQVRRIALDIPEVHSVVYHFASGRAGVVSQTRVSWLDLADGTVLAQYRADTNIYALAFSPDGRAMIAGDALGKLHVLELPLEV